MINGNGIKRRVLLIDDEVNLAKMLSMLLETRGYEVKVAYTAAEALEQISSEVDLIILDLVLPDSHGFELCRQFKTTEKTRHIPIIMLSAHSLYEDKVQGLYLGADDFLPKPCEHEELVARMEAVLRRHSKERVAPYQSNEKEIINELRMILDESKITPHFQPIYLLEDKKFFGVEILTRPDTNTVLRDPEIFFRAAMQYGLYNELEILAWTLAIIGMAKSPQEEKLFFNCTPYFIESSQFRKVKTLFERHHIDPARVVMEITERSAVADFKMFFEHLQDYRSCGFQFAVDDVGGGYASLESLVEIQPGIVKIDRHIIKDLANNKYKQSIVKFIVAFSQENGILSIAEGIESPEELAAVKELGVTAGQGFYLGRPTSDVDWQKFLTPDF